MNSCKPPRVMSNLRVTTHPICPTPEGPAPGDSDRSHNADRILVVDRGKCKSAACVDEPTSGEVEFSSFATTREELTRR